MKFIFCFFLLFSLAVQSTTFESREELKVAVFIEPPFVDFVDGQWKGENIEIIQLLAKKINLEPHFIHCPLARCLSLVENGLADMIMGLMRSPTREDYLTFIEPPYILQHKPLRFFTLAAKGIDFEQFQDLENLLVGTIRGAAYYPEFDSSTTIKKVEITTREQLLKMLLKGHIDTFLEREESILPLINNLEYQQKIALATYQHDEIVASYIAISKKSPIKNLADKLSFHLSQAIESGHIIQSVK